MVGVVDKNAEVARLAKSKNKEDLEKLFKMAMDPDYHAALVSNNTALRRENRARFQIAHAVARTATDEGIKRVLRLPGIADLKDNAGVSVSDLLDVPR